MPKNISPSISSVLKFFYFDTGEPHTQLRLYGWLSKPQVTQQSIEERYNHICKLQFTCISIVWGCCHILFHSLVPMCPNPVENLSRSRGNVHLWCTVASKHCATAKEIKTVIRSKGLYDIFDMTTALINLTLLWSFAVQFLHRHRISNVSVS